MSGALLLLLFIVFSASWIISGISVFTYVHILHISFFSCPFKTQMWVKQLLLVNLGHNIPSRCIHFMIIWFISLWRFFCFMTSHDRISSLLILQAVCYLIGSTRLLCIPHKETSLVVSETRPFWNCWTIYSLLNYCYLWQLFMLHILIIVDVDL